ncbi:adhesion G protein-coupled receptor E1-like [Centruroides sculpturatus]|uniref:adhesion G protein-coupled receptor E1-like n=1 Tax=Centruroides sculpturatus TaxID=218467 RepID=UPI000C6D6172|nr:adhesion G protein-coupled receptor E1-like [Centruroides sculpturatus]
MFQVILVFASVKIIFGLSKVGFMPLKAKYSTPDEAFAYYYDQNQPNFNCFGSQCIVGVCWKTCTCGCLCFPGFGGSECDQYIGACTEKAQKFCKPFLCLDDPRKTLNFSCACPEGWMYSTDPDDSDCYDIDECVSETNPVCGTQQCINTQGSYICADVPAGPPEYNPDIPSTVPSGSYTPVDPDFKIADMTYIEKQLIPYKKYFSAKEMKQIRRDHFEIAAVYFYKYPLAYQLYMKRPIDNKRAQTYVTIEH